MPDRNKIQITARPLNRPLVYRVNAEFGYTKREHAYTHASDRQTDKGIKAWLLLSADRPQRPRPMMATTTGNRRQEPMWRRSRGVHSPY